MEVELSSFQKSGKEGLKQRFLDLERLALSREDAMEHYAKQAEERKKKFNANLAPKSIKEGSFILHYNDRFDYNKSDIFVPHWEGPFKVLETFDNGSYQLMDASRALHKTRVNGWRIKPYFTQILKDQEVSAQVGLNNDKPLGVISQDPFLAQHVSCISSMSIGPITRPCIGTDDCSPSTTNGHFSIDREDECTSRLQGGDDITKGQEQEAA